MLSFCTVRACVLSCFSYVSLFATSWMAAHQAPLSMGFPRQKYLSGLPWPLPGHLPDPGIEPESLGPLSLEGGFFTLSATGKALFCTGNVLNAMKVLTVAHLTFATL